MPARGSASTSMKSRGDGSEMGGRPRAASALTRSAGDCAIGAWRTTIRSPVAGSGTPATAARGVPSSSEPRIACSASSIGAKGTISPPILAKRLTRPTMVMKPSSSRVATSPVRYQPSRITAAVASGRFR